MTEPIFSTWVRNQREYTMVIAGYVLVPQVPIFMNFYKFSDLKTIQKYATMGVVILNDNPSTTSGIGTGIVSDSTPSELDTVTEVVAQLKFTKKLNTSDFSETGTGTGKWKTTIQHNFKRLPDVKIIANKSVIVGDIEHDNNLEYFVLTLSQRIACEVHLS